MFSMIIMFICITPLMDIAMTIGNQLRKSY